MSSLNSDSVIQDARLEQLEKWLTAVFGARDFELRPASADASFRRYFRVTRGASTLIAMDAPPDKEDMGPYIRVAQMLADVGVNAPRVLERNEAEGFLLNTDLGSRTYLAELEADANAADRLYKEAINALVQIQARGQAHAQTLPNYDDVLLRRELTLFPEWFAERHLGVGDMAQAGLEPVYDVLVATALEQPRVFVHRDYHSRNLMAADGARFGANPGILDFQDAVNGALTYDLVSLLRDCYIAWPVEQVHQWVAYFYEQARQHAVPVPGDEARLLRWFDLMGVQRHLKAIGIFARLWHRDGKSGYLKDIPRTLDYVRDVAARYDELTPLLRFIDSSVMPRMERGL